MRIPIFPEPGLDQSVLTPVLLGVIVSWLFTETLGWTFVGLVVPGYLAAVFMIHPAAGFIEVFEAVLTYGLARAVGELLPRIGVGFRIFGRERFLLIIAASLVVRVAVEGIGLPALFGAAPWAYSMGFVIVPLAANACWKTGLPRGIVEHGVPTLLVLLAMKLVLLPLTNLSLGGFELLTQDVAGSFLASPKLYLVLLTTAVLASFANVRFGWDFGGVLVPSLLALAWFQPIRVASTFAEAIVIALAGSACGRLVSLEGPRRIVVFLGVEYLLRFGVGHALGRSLPASALADLNGVGYLLPTLVALKLAGRGPLVFLPTAFTAAAGFAIGGGVGLTLQAFDPAPPPDPRVPAPAVTTIPAIARVMRDGFEPASPVAGAATLSSAVARVPIEPRLSRARFAMMSDPALDAPVLPPAASVQERRELRRRVFLPLLAGEPDLRDIAAAAQELGYRASASESSVAMFGEGRPLAGLMRPKRTGPRTTIVVALQAQDRGLRDAAHRIATTLEAQGLLLVAQEGGFDESLRTIFDLVRGDEPIELVLVRGARPDVPGSSFGVFGGDRAVGERLRAGIRSFGIELAEAGPDRVARRITGGFDREDVVVNVHVDELAQEALSLNRLRRSIALFEESGRLALEDGIGGALESIAGAPLDRAASRPASDLLGLAKMAARDESTTAARSLRSLIDQGAARIGIADDPRGPAVVLTARTERGLLVAAEIGEGAPSVGPGSIGSGTLATCQKNVAKGGACLAVLQ